MSLHLLIIWPFFCALIVRLITEDGRFGKRAAQIRDTLVLIGAFTETLLVGFLMTENMRAVVPLFGGFGLGLRFYHFTSIYCLIAAVAWLLAVMLSREYIKHYPHPERFYSYLFLTLGAVEGIFMASDFFTLFLFFELMSFVSYPLVAHDEKSSTLRAANTYLAVSVIGGLFILMGMFIVYRQIGSLTFSTVFTFSGYTNRRLILIAGALMLVGFGAKAGMYPLHIWLPKAHPAAPAPASALLSGLLTKTGIFGILSVTTTMLYGNKEWSDILLVLGTITMVWGALCALLSSNLKKLLACSSMSQIGFILVGIGCYALNSSVEVAAGIALHMINHSLIKMILFGAAGVIYMGVHSLELADMKGWGRGKPLLNAAFLSGALGIGGIPFWNGYISKSLLHEGIVSISNKPVEILFLISGGLTIAYMAKVYITIFIRHPDRDFDENQRIDSFSAAALIAPAIALPIIGVVPNITAVRLINFSLPQFRVAQLGRVYFFSGEMLSGALISFLIGLTIFFLFVRRHPCKNYIPSGFDLEDKFYRPLLLNILPAIFGAICTVLDRYIFEPIVSAVTFCGAFAGRVCDNAVDGVLWLNRRTVMRPIARKPRNITPAEEKLNEVSDSLHNVAGGLSFGLLMTCIGLCATILYLIIRSFL